MGILALLKATFQYLGKSGGVACSAGTQYTLCLNVKAYFFEKRSSAELALRVVNFKVSRYLG